MFAAETQRLRVHWVLCAYYAKKFCEVLNLKFHELSYYINVVVWYPDVRWDCNLCHAVLAAATQCEGGRAVMAGATTITVTE